MYRFAYFRSFEALRAIVARPKYLRIVLTGWHDVRGTFSNAIVIRMHS